MTVSVCQTLIILEYPTQKINMHIGVWLYFSKGLFSHYLVKMCLNNMSKALLHLLFVIYCRLYVAVYFMIFLTAIFLFQSYDYEECRGFISTHSTAHSVIDIDAIDNKFCDCFNGYVLMWCT